MDLREIKFTQLNSQTQTKRSWVSYVIQNKTIYGLNIVQYEILFENFFCEEIASSYNTYILNFLEKVLESTSLLYNLIYWENLILIHHG